MLKLFRSIWVFSAWLSTFLHGARLMTVLSLPLSPTTTSTTRKRLTLFPSLGSEKVPRIAVWPGLLASVGNLDLPSSEHVLILDRCIWALGIRGQNCKIKFCLTSTPTIPPHSFLDTNRSTRVLLPFNLTALLQSGETSDPLFMLLGQKWWELFVSSLAFIQGPNCVHRASPYFLVVILISKYIYFWREISYWNLVRVYTEFIVTCEIYLLGVVQIKVGFIWKQQSSEICQSHLSAMMGVGGNSCPVWCVLKDFRPTKGHLTTGHTSASSLHFWDLARMRIRPAAVNWVTLTEGYSNPPSFWPCFPKSCLLFTMQLIQNPVLL